MCGRGARKRRGGDECARLDGYNRCEQEVATLSHLEFGRFGRLSDQILGISCVKKKKASMGCDMSGVYSDAWR